MHKYTFTDPSSKQVEFNAEFVMTRANLQYGIRGQQQVTKLYKISKNMIITKKRS